MSESREQKSGSKFNIVRRIAEFFNLDTEGRLDSFFTRVEKDLTRRIKRIKSGILSAETSHEESLDKLKDSLEDAEQDLINVYLSVPEDQLETNAKQDVYIDVYLTAIEVAEDKVNGIKSRIAEVNVHHKSSISEERLQIESYEARIEMFKSM